MVGSGPARFGGLLTGRPLPGPAHRTLQTNPQAGGEVWAWGPRGRGHRCLSASAGRRPQPMRRLPRMTCEHANTQTHGHVNTRTRRHVNTLTREHGRPARGAPCLSAPSKAAFALSPHPQTPAGRGPLSGEHRRLPPRTSRETRPWTPHERRGRAGPGPNRPSTGRPTGGPGRAPQPGG